MPEIKTPTSPRDLSLSFRLEVLFIMTFPNEEYLRKKSLATVAAKMEGKISEFDVKDIHSKELPEDCHLKGIPKGFTQEDWKEFSNVACKELDEVYFQMGGRQTLCDSPEYEKIIENYYENQYKGEIAGLILVFIWRMETSNVGSGGPSVNKAIFLETNLDKRRVKGPKDKNLPFNETYIRKLWSDYKSVSHLWAAFMQWQVVGKPMEFSPFNVPGIWGFISLAEKFRQFGTTYIPRGQKTSILINDETWFPSKNFKPIEFPFIMPPLTPKELKVLEEYRAPTNI